MSHSAFTSHPLGPADRTDGFTLMVLYFLVHVKQPPVLPNLQRIAPVRPLTEEQVMLEGRNVYFFDDVETLRQEWSSINFETVGEL
jgi:terminal uridylyltransferase